MRNLVVKSIFHLAESLRPAYGKHAAEVIKNQLKSMFSKNRENKYLFILSPPYCGSTLLNELISTSKSVSVNNKYGSREGQTLPTVRDIMYTSDRWDNDYDFDWEIIKQEWLKYWDTTQPILLEKSPANITRAESIQNAFHPSYYIIFYRNPYAHCESLIRRNQSNITAAANFAIHCLQYQKNNISILNHSLDLSYELLTENTSKAVEKISSLLPQLQDIQYDMDFNAHNFLKKKSGIRNLNSIKINKLSSDEIDKINVVFNKHRELLNYFNYDLL